MAQQNTNPNPQTQSAQPTPQTTQAQQVQHVHHYHDSGFGWGAMLVAGAVGFLFGQLLAENPAQPATTKHFWQ